MSYKIDSDYRLMKKMDENFEYVTMTPCFPQTMPKGFLSVQDEKGNEIELINDLSDLGEESRVIVKKYLNFKSMFFMITAIEEVNEQFGIRFWQVKTNRGERSFQTELDSWPDVSGKLVTIKDLNGDIYKADVSKLDSKSQKKFSFLLG